ncbi:sugar phosphate isomerase/epimerase family protein [Kushneria aurantia]|uniref:Sugar phosphate isomerase/epimerase family protein n=1 Tax=Kushneria aurantia TaxID=504092 RepID=A0ABV6G0I1_9GAMM|nr:sugar phosphate isomerase/epimerase family protein [Kushneria aurantia]
MAIGLSTYAFFWRGSTRMQTPMTLEDMLEETAELGGAVLQICDYAAVETFDDARLTELSRHAKALGITLELGTRGLNLAHIERYLQIAERLGVSMLRSMCHSGEDHPDDADAIRRIEALLPQLENQGVVLALETYEQIPLNRLMNVIETVDSPHLGICLDPANCVAALEIPQQVIERSAERVVNLHIKDFAFTRSPAWVGFQLIGAPLGEGLLPFDDMMARLQPAARRINCIIEHWLPWQHDSVTTHDTETRWTRHGINLLRNRHG